MYTGLTGALKIERHKDSDVFYKIAYISGWSIEESTELVETTKIGKFHRNAYSSFQSWSASADGIVVFEKCGDDVGDGQDDEQARICHERLFKAKHCGERVRVQLHLNDRTNTYFVGDGYIESLSVDIAAENAASVTISIKGTGVLDLLVNGESVKNVSPRELSPLETLFQMGINDEGYLFVKEANTSPYHFDLNKETGILTVSLRRGAVGDTD